MKIVTTLSGVSILLFSFISAFSQKSIKIGKQTWMTENLNVFTFRNGDSIPEAKTNEDWIRAEKAGQPAWCYYNNDPQQGIFYGKLYNWYAVNDKRGLAPKGWHIPNNNEWRMLANSLGGKSVAGNKMKTRDGWSINGNGNNSSGFSGLPGGRRRYGYGDFDFLYQTGCWWSSTEYDIGGAWFIDLYYKASDMNNSYTGKGAGASVRCVK
jgi:uncharacterized protein (TIGR02145 family)